MLYRKDRTARTCWSGLFYCISALLCCFLWVPI
nr:MAG TPA: hypothetical protein [Caudoviricetes sp.]